MLSVSLDTLNSVHNVSKTLHTSLHHDAEYRIKKDKAKLFRYEDQSSLESNDDTSSDINAAAAAVGVRLGFLGDKEERVEREKNSARFIQPPPSPPLVTEKPLTASEIMQTYNIRYVEDIEQEFSRVSTPKKYARAAAQDEFLKESSAPLHEISNEHRQVYQSRIRKRDLPSSSTPSTNIVSLDYMHTVVKNWKPFKCTLLKRRRENSRCDLMPSGSSCSDVAILEYKSRMCKDQNDTLTATNAEILQRFNLHICAVKTCPVKSGKFKLGMCVPHYTSYYRRQAPVRAEVLRRKKHDQEVLLALFSVDPTRQ